MIGVYIEDYFKIDEYDKHKFLELVMCLKRVEEVEIYIAVHDGVLTTRVIP